jgi:ketosteroid isomerase-like protein
LTVDEGITARVAVQPADVVVRFNTAWAAGNLPAAMQFVAEHAVYTLYIDGELLPVGGDTVGRADIEEGLRLLRRQFEYLLYRPRDMHLDGGTARYQVEFMYRHRTSGEILSGRFRIVLRIEDGLIVRAEEYHDRARVEAFLRLYGS